MIRSTYRIWSRLQRQNESNTSSYRLIQRRLRMYREQYREVRTPWRTATIRSHSSAILQPTDIRTLYQRLLLLLLLIYLHYVNIGHCPGDVVTCEDINLSVATHFHSSNRFRSIALTLDVNYLKQRRPECVIHLPRYNFSPVIRDIAETGIRNWIHAN